MDLSTVQIGDKLISHIKKCSMVVEEIRWATAYNTWYVCGAAKTFWDSPYYEEVWFDIEKDIGHWELCESANPLEVY